MKLYIPPALLCTLPLLLDSTSAQEGVPSPAPQTEQKQVPEMVVEGSVVHTLPSRTITILRGEPSTLPDPAPVSEANAVPVQQQAEQNPHAGSVLPISILALRATVYNKQRSFLQWRDPESGAEYEAWSNINFDHLSALGHVESADRKWILFLAVVNIDTAAVNPATGQTASEPAHPAIPAGGPGFVVTKGNSSDQGSLAPLAALHDLYATKASELIASAAAQKLVKEQQALEQANPAPPQDNVMWFRPRKGSRYLPQEGGDQ